VDERKLAKLDRLADGQFSCDTGLSSCVVCSTARLQSVSPVEAVRADPISCRSSGLQGMPAVPLSDRKVPERAGIDNESDQVP
jgi:hypothetical protein